MKKLGFVGLGIMGKPMAKNLLKAGYELAVYTHNPETVAELAALGATPASCGREVAEKSDVVFTMVQNSPQVREAILGKGGIAEGMRPGTVVVDTSSISPVASREIAAEVESRGGEMIDAPVSGGEPKAIEGTLAFMCGGKQEVFDEVKDILAAMGSSVIRCGAIGAGNTTKLANQIIVAVNIAAVSEALVLGKKAGVDPEAIYRAIRGGLAGSAVMDAKAPMMIDRNFKPGFRIGLHIKDLNNAMEAAREAGIDLPLSSKVLAMMDELAKEGKDALDHSAICQYYENQAGIVV